MRGWSRVGGLFLVLLLAGGCSPRAGEDTLLASRSARGGMCPTGPCVDQLTITGDGRWVREDQAGPAGSGRLGDADLDALQSSAESSVVADGGTPSPGCGGAADGQDVAYTWVAGGAQLSATGCVLPLPPVAIELDALAERLR